jgi:hypothetical protein
MQHAIQYSLLTYIAGFALFQVYAIGRAIFFWLTDPGRRWGS